MKLNYELLYHQKKGVEKLIKLTVGALFMEQGTGKSITTFEIARIRYEKNKIDKVIWLCPCSAKENIKKEVIKHCPDELIKIFVICGIETLSTSVRTISYLLQLTKNNKCFLVVDESLLIKNPRAYRTAHILKISEQCKYKIILNGTPISRNEADLFSQFYLLDWRILGYKSYWSFASNHLEYDKYGKLRRVLNKDYLAEKISPYTYQVKKAECIKLPPKKYSTSSFDLTSEQSEEYSRAAYILMSNINEFSSTSVYRLFSGLQSIISGNRLIFSKNGQNFTSVNMFKNPLDNPRLNSVLYNLNSEQTIIFCRYTSEITQLCDVLSHNAVRYDGTMSIKEKNIALNVFENKKPYLIANTACASFSLNLQFCHNVINVSHNWELGTRLQSEDRVHRYGQTEEVNITDICADGTIDEKILSCIYNKAFLLEQLKKEIKSAKNATDTLEKIIYGSRYNHQIFDCSELEDESAKNI